MRKSSLSLLAALLLSAGCLRADTTSYSYDFTDTSTLNTNFTISHYTSGSPADPTNYTGYVGDGTMETGDTVSIISNTAFTLTLGNTYTVSATYTLNNYLGVGFCTDPNATNDFMVWKSISFQSSDSYFNLANYGDSASAQDWTSLSGSSFSLGDSVTYTMTLTPTSSSTYDISYTLYDITTSTTISTGSTSVTNESLSGNLYAYSLMQQSGSGEDQMTSFSASVVPEPATYAAIGGLGALGFALLRRRRKA